MLIMFLFGLGILLSLGLLTDVLGVLATHQPCQIGVPVDVRAGIPIVFAVDWRCRWDRGATRIASRPTRPRIDG